MPAVLGFVSGAIEPTGQPGCWRVTADWPDGTVRVQLGQRGVVELGWPEDPVTLRVVDAAGSELARRTLDPSLGRLVGFETLVGSLELETAGPRLELCNALR